VYKTAERPRGSVCVCEGAQIATNRGSVGSKNGRWKNGPFEISQD
jgi:hypothetical protein